MTLVVSVVSPDFVFQVSDRRVTLEHADGRREIREEPLTKAVVYCDRAVFGFTGYAEVDLRRSDLWIADQLKDVRDLGEGFDRMRDRLSVIFRRPRYRAGHTVTAAGFKLNNDGTTTPFYAIVTNQFADGQWLVKPAKEFRCLIELALAGAVGVFAAPGWLAGARLQSLQEEVAAADTLEGAVASVVSAMREVAAAHDEVGPDLLLSVLPRSSVAKPEILLLTGGPPGETPTFHYLAADGDPVQYGPTFVCNGSIMSGLVVKPLSEDERLKSDAGARAFQAARRPQHAYLVPVRTSVDASGRPSRAPDIGVALTGAAFIYHPTEDVALVMTADSLVGFPELKTVEQLEQLRSEWGDAVALEYISEVTGIGWND
jgi:hypothetical protein